MASKYEKILNNMVEMKQGDTLIVECGSDAYTVYGYFQKYGVTGFSFSKKAQTIVVLRK